MCLRSISLLSKLVVTLALRSSSQTASQDATIDSYLELHADYLKTLDAEDASIISNVAEVERTSTRPILYHACTVYIAFLAALYDSLLFDRPLSFFLSGNMSYAVANLTWRVFQGPTRRILTMIHIVACLCFLFSMVPHTCNSQNKVHRLVLQGANSTL